jgi:hypothetical protein
MVNEYKLREFEEDIDLVKTHGSMEGIIKKLKTDKDKGITPD